MKMYAGRKAYLLPEPPPSHLNPVSLPRGTCCYASVSNLVSGCFLHIYIHKYAHTDCAIYFPHSCDQVMNKSNLKEGYFILSHGQEMQFIMIGKAWWWAASIIGHI